MRIAALPMYDLVGLEAANDALWTAIAQRLTAAGVEGAPERLTRSRPLEAVWTDPGLLLGQTCGYPLVTALGGQVRLVATPKYGAQGCDGALYRSAVVVRRADPAQGLADLRGRRAAVNDLGSNSGMNLLRAEVAPLAHGAPFFGHVAITGAHAASVQAVAEAEADVAAIDCVTFAHLQRLRPRMTQGLRVLAWTTATPGLPLIAAATTDAALLAALRQALAAVARDPALAAVRATLLLDGFEILPQEAYDTILALERDAISRGYPILA
jgi:ABC-type phosphate/phosphonate transport system substrate-binding protein